MSNLFTKDVKRQALKRSDMECEAEGAFYGWPEGHRCNANLAYGVEFDHVLARSNGGDGSLENCLAVCVRCHKHKTTQFDTPRAAKTKRQSDKHTGVVKAKGNWPSRKFNQPRYDNTKFIGGET